MFNSPERRRRRSASPTLSSEAMPQLTPLRPRRSARDHGGYDATPAKTSKSQLSAPYDATPAKTSKTQQQSAPFFTPTDTTDALKQKVATAEVVPASSSAGASGASDVASLLVTRVDESGAVEFLLDGNVYRVEDETVLRSILPDGKKVEQSITTEKPAAVPAQPRRRSTQDFVKAQRAARAALASSTAPSDAAPPAPSGAGAKEKRVQAVAECSQVSGIVGWLKEQRATSVAVGSTPSAAAPTCGAAKDMGVDANANAEVSQVGDNKWRRLLAAELGQLPAASATTSLVEELGLA